MTLGAFPSSPSSHGDDLAAVVVRRLEKRNWCKSWGLAKTLLLGVPSFGLIPLIAWPARFREYVAEESQAMQELAQWAKMRGRQPAAVGPLMAAAEDTAASPLPFIAALVLAALVVGVYVIQFAKPNYAFSLDQLIELTYSRSSRMSGSSPLTPQDFVYRVWVIALSLGYCVQWLQVRAHAADLKRFVERFNPIIQTEGLPPVRLPVRGWVLFRPLWILTAVVLAMYGAWWGIPMMLAGMAQKRYTSLTGRVVRYELAKRVRDVVTLRQTQTEHQPRSTGARSQMVQALIEAANLPEFMNSLLTAQAITVGGTEAAGFLIERGNDNAMGLRPIAHVRPDQSTPEARTAALNAFQDLVRPCIQQGKDGAIEVGGPNDAAEAQFCLVTLLRTDNKVVAVSAVITRCINIERAKQHLVSMQLVAGYFELFARRRAAQKDRLIAEAYQQGYQQTMQLRTFPAAGRCLNPRCLAAIRPESHFCTRCGAAIREEATA